MKDELMLKNNFIIRLESGSSLSDMKALFTDKSVMMEAWGELTEDNLSEVTIRNGSGIVVSRLTGVVLVSETSIVHPDGKILTSFSLREKTDIERRLDQVEENLEVQDGAIADLGAAVSGIAKEGGLKQWEDFME